MALYLNGLLCEEQAQTGTWSPQEFGSHLTLGQSGGGDAEAAFDNLRIYDYCKTNFQDRNREKALGLMRVWLVLSLTQDETDESFNIESGVKVR